MVVWTSSIYKGFLDKVMLKGFSYREESGRLVGTLNNINDYSNYSNTSNSK